MLLITLFCVHLTLISHILCDGTYDVTTYGADPKGKEKSTDAIKKAIEEASGKGGGVVHFPEGQYLTASVNLKSNVVLELADKALITFSKVVNDYPSLSVKVSDGTLKVGKTPLIYAYGEKNITIKGKGTLDGQGSDWWKSVTDHHSDDVKPYEDFTRPPLIHFYETKGIVLQDFTVKNSPFYNINPVLSQDITIKGVTVDNPSDSKNTDGINCYSCENVHISGVTISTGDDCVVLKSGGVGAKGVPTQNVVIENSHMNRGHGGVVMGSATSGGLNNITVTGCVFEGTDRGLYIKTLRTKGGVIQNIHYKNITMNSIAKEGIALNLLYDSSNQDAAMHSTNIKKEPFTDTTPVIKNLEYTDIKGSSKKNPIFFVGLPESLITDIQLKNIKITSSEKNFFNNTKNVEIDGKVQDNAFFYFN